MFSAGWWRLGLTVGERCDGSGGDLPPMWALDAEEAIASAVTAPLVQRSFSSWQDAYGVALRPLVDWAVRRLPDGSWAVRSFTERLRSDLATLAVRTLTLEVHQRRAAGTLTGADGRERFADFVGTLSQPRQLVAVLSRYPVLARLLMQACRLAAEAHAEMVARFAADRTAVADCFFAGVDPGEPVAVDGARGDSHRRGRSVAVIQFAGNHRIVYKPRSVASYLDFSTLVRLLNERMPELELRAARTLERHGYGWQEYVSAQSCADLSSVRRFHRRAGALLALLHAVRATDVHHGNVIACSDQPVVIDMETILHPELVRAAVMRDPAAQTLARSVHRTGILPTFLLGDHGALDISALGGDRGHPLPNKGIGWIDAATDRMRLTREPVRFAGSANRPTLQGASVEPADHVDDLIGGFQDGYAAIVAHREAFLKAINQMSTPTTRVVFRPTHLYQTLLTESTHPDLLVDAAARDEHFRLLSTVACDLPGQSLAVPHELADLWNGDVPIFVATPDSTDLRASTGLRLANVLEMSGRAAALDKIRLMDAADRRLQEWIIRAALATRRRPGAGLPQDTFPEDPLAAARAIGDEICDQAAVAGERMNWLGVEPVQGRMTLMPMGASLGNGYTGVALFLAQLANLTGVDRYERAARAAVQAIPQVFAAVADRTGLIAEVGCGGYDGFGGISYALARISTLLGDNVVRQWAYRAVDLAAAAATTVGRPGLADGWAGCLAAMLAVHAELGHPPALRLAAYCAHRLALLAEAPSGPDRSAVTATDFARGPVGIGWALSRYADATALPRFASAAAEIRSWGPASGPETWQAEPGISTPGLLNGLAGAGCRLLRRAAPERVPSVPHLAPPPYATALASASPTAHTQKEQQ